MVIYYYITVSFSEHTASSCYVTVAEDVPGPTLDYYFFDPGTALVYNIAGNVAYPVFDLFSWVVTFAAVIAITGPFAVFGAELPALIYYFVVADPVPNFDLETKG